MSTADADLRPFGLKDKLSLRFKHEEFRDGLYVRRKTLSLVVFVGSGALFEGRVELRPTREASFGPPRRPPAGFRRLRGRPRFHQNSQNPSAHPRRRQSGGFVAALPRQSQVQHAPARQAQLRIGGQDQPCPPVGLLGVAHPRARPPERLLEKAEGVLQIEAPDVGAP